MSDTELIIVAIFNIIETITLPEIGEGYRYAIRSFLFALSQSALSSPPTLVYTPFLEIQIDSLEIYRQIPLLPLPLSEVPGSTSLHCCSEILGVLYNQSPPTLLYSPIKLFSKENHYTHWYENHGEVVHRPIENQIETTVR